MGHNMHCHDNYELFSVSKVKKAQQSGKITFHKLIVLDGVNSVLAIGYLHPYVMRLVFGNGREQFYKMALSWS